MDGNMRPTGESSVSFDHILSCLQGKLQKSREAGVKLHSLMTAMNDIHNTLGSALPVVSLNHFDESTFH